MWSKVDRCSRYARYAGGIEASVGGAGSSWGARVEREGRKLFVGIYSRRRDAELAAERAAELVQHQDEAPCVVGWHVDGEPLCVACTGRAGTGGRLPGLIMSDPDPSGQLECAKCCEVVIARYFEKAIENS